MAVLERLEFGKYCESPDGRVERTDSGELEHGILGCTRRFPRAESWHWNPATFGPEANTQRRRYLPSTPGYVFRPVVFRSDAAGYGQVFVQVRHRREVPDKPRTYTLARYLVALPHEEVEVSLERAAARPPSLWYHTDRQNPLVGLTRAQARALEPIPFAEDPEPGPIEAAAWRFADTALVHVMSATPVVVRMVGDAAMPVEQFFAWADALWYRLPAILRPFFSCGWNVVGDQVSELTLSCTHEPSPFAAVFDPRHGSWQPPASMRTGDGREVPYVPEWSEAGRAYVEAVTRVGDVAGGGPQRAASALRRLLSNLPTWASSSGPIDFADAGIRRRFRQPGLRAHDHDLQQGLRRYLRADDPAFRRMTTADFYDRMQRVRALRAVRLALLASPGRSPGCFSRSLDFLWRSCAAMGADRWESDAERAGIGRGAPFSARLDHPQGQTSGRRAAVSEGPEAHLEGWTDADLGRALLELVRTTCLKDPGASSASVRVLSELPDAVRPLAVPPSGVDAFREQWTNAINRVLQGGAIDADVGPHLELLNGPHPPEYGRWVEESAVLVLCALAERGGRSVVLSPDELSVVLRFVQDEERRALLAGYFGGATFEASWRPLIRTLPELQRRVMLSGWTRAWGSRNVPSQATVDHAWRWISALALETSECVHPLLKVSYLCGMAHPPVEELWRLERETGLSIPVQAVGWNAEELEALSRSAPAGQQVAEPGARGEVSGVEVSRRRTDVVRQIADAIDNGWIPEEVLDIVAALVFRNWQYFLEAALGPTKEVPDERWLRLLRQWPRSYAVALSGVDTGADGVLDTACAPAFLTATQLESRITRLFGLAQSGPRSGGAYRRRTRLAGMIDLDGGLAREVAGVLVRYARQAAYGFPGPSPAGAWPQVSDPVPPQGGMAGAGALVATTAALAERQFPDEGPPWKVIPTIGVLLRTAGCRLEALWQRVAFAWQALLLLYATPPEPARLHPGQLRLLFEALGDPDTRERYLNSFEPGWHDLVGPLAGAFMSRPRREGWDEVYAGSPMALVFAGIPAQQQPALNPQVLVRYFQPRGGSGRPARDIWELLRRYVDQPPECVQAHQVYEHWILPELSAARLSREEIRQLFRHWPELARGGSIEESHDGGTVGARLEHLLLLAALAYLFFCVSLVTGVGWYPLVMLRWSIAELLGTGGLIWLSLLVTFVWRMLVRPRLNERLRMVRVARPAGGGDAPYPCVTVRHVQSERVIELDDRFFAVVQLLVERHQWSAPVL